MRLYYSFDLEFSSIFFIVPIGCCIIVIWFSDITQYAIFYFWWRELDLCGEGWIFEDLNLETCIGIWYPGISTCCWLDWYIIRAKSRFSGYLEICSDRSKRICLNPRVKYCFSFRIWDSYIEEFIFWYGEWGFIFADYALDIDSFSREVEASIGMYIGTIERSFHP